MQGIAGRRVDLSRQFCLLHTALLAVAAAEEIMFIQQKQAGGAAQGLLVVQLALPLRKTHTLHHIGTY